MSKVTDVLTRDRNTLVRAGILPSASTPYANEMANRVGYGGRAFDDELAQKQFASIAQNSGGRAAQMLGQIAGEPMSVEDKSREDLNRIVTDSQAAARQIYGQAEPTNKDKRRRLSERAKRLAPIGPISGGSAANPSNPYSIDTRGLIGGLASLAVGLINKERNERVYGENGFAGELMDLQGAEERNLKREEQITDFVGRDVPRRVAAKEIEDRQIAVKKQDLANALTRIEAQGETYENRERARAAAQASLEELRQTGRMSLAEYNAQQRRLLEADRFNRIERSAATRASTGATTQLMQTIRQPLSAINRSIADIQEELALNPNNPELKATLDGLREREADIVKAQLNVMVGRANMTMEQANSILDDLGYSPLPAGRTTGGGNAPAGGRNTPASGGNAGGGTGPVRAQDFPGFDN